MEFTLTEIISILIKRKWIIIISVILLTSATFAVSEVLIEREYTASLSLYVVPNKDNPDIYEPMNDLNYAQKVINTYIVILKTNNFLDNVSKESNLEYSKDELRDMITLNAVNETEIFEVHVTSKEPRDSLILANTISRLAPQKIMEIKKADAVKLVDPAIMPSKPSAPNVLLNTAIGFVLGFILGIMTAFLREIMDKRIKDEDDFLKHYNVPILGMVPLIEDK